MLSNFLSVPKAGKKHGVRARNYAIVLTGSEWNQRAAILPHNREISDVEGRATVAEGERLAALVAQLDGK